MSFLHLKEAKKIQTAYATYGYLDNPFPESGRVAGDVYVERPETAELGSALSDFLTQPAAPGGFWVVQAESGLGKSNFLQHIEYELASAVRSSQVEGVVFRYVGQQLPSAWNLVEQTLMTIGSERLRQLLALGSTLPSTPDSQQDTDIGRFFDTIRRQLPLPAGKVHDPDVEFLMRWLTGERTRSEERQRFHLISTDRLSVGTALAYLQVLFSLLKEASICSRMVLLIDEFEDVQNLSKAAQNDYVNTLKSLVNVFNWNGLFVILASQEAVIQTLRERYPSFSTRLKTVSLRPLETPDDAVLLAEAYKEYAHRRYLLDSPKAKPKDRKLLIPSKDAIENQWRKLAQEMSMGFFEPTGVPGRLKPRVRQRQLLDSLHQWMREKISQE